MTNTKTITHNSTNISTKKGLSLNLIKYELVNLSSNIFVLIFGIVFPIGMAMLMAFVFGGNAEYINGAYYIYMSGVYILRASIHTRMFLSMSIMIPLATMLMGHATNYATELETGSVMRFKLFGYSDKTMVVAKLIAQMLALVIAMIVYSLVLFIVLDITVPTAISAIIFIVFFLIFSASLFLLAHAIASLCGQMGKTFGIIMGLYFTIAILGGNMGPSPSQLPNGMRHIAMGLPLYYVSEYFQDFWSGGAMGHWLGFITTTAAFAVISLVVFIISVLLIKKGKVKQDAKPVYYD
ncbi:MAG: ABC transporter permease [Firmicutes bacterium]|nr:ABC transporter permease [Bacillota bacterium]